MSKISMKGVARDVVLVGGLAEGGLSVAAALGPHLPASQVAVISLALAGCGLVVSAAEDIMQGQSPLSAISQALSGVSGLFGGKTPAIPAVQAAAPAPAVMVIPTPEQTTAPAAATAAAPAPEAVAPATSPVVPDGTPPEHPQPPVGG